MQRLLGALSHPLQSGGELRPKKEVQLATCGLGWPGASPLILISMHGATCPAGAGR